MRPTAILIAPLFLVSIFCAGASASTFTTLFKFAFETAENPHGAVFKDKDGALYGTSYFFGPDGHGVVFKLSPPAEGKTKWTHDILYSFKGGLDGAGPVGALVKDSSGALIGTAFQGGTENSGAIFKLTPPAKGQSEWTESVIHNFSASEGNPSGDLLQDRNGNLYGTCSSSPQNYGQVFRLTPPQGQGDWTEDILYVFQDRNDGYLPSPSLAGDGTALFGTTRYGGPADLGTVYQLTPPESGNGPWTKTVLHTFAGADGASPFAGVVERNGKLFGTTSHGGDLDYGTVFQLAPPKPGHTAWKETVIHSFTGGSSDGRAPYEELTLGKRGTLFGGTVEGGEFGNKYRHGTIFSLTPPSAGQSQWTEQILHSFNNSGDGNSPARLWFDKSGTIYGVTQYGMAHNTGSVFQLTP